VISVAGRRVQPVLLGVDLVQVDVGRRHVQTRRADLGSML
jgi:hypothetical protein